MRRLAVCVFGLVLATGAILLTNCSGPLESDGGPTPGPIYKTDTIYSGDTVIYTDTVAVTDTVIVVVIDTVYLPTSFCAQLSSRHKAIVWLFQNPEGSFKMDFEAASTRDWPIQKLLVEVGDYKYFWEPQVVTELEIEQYLEEDSSVRIYTEAPHVLGHAIDICLKLKDL